MRTFDFNKVCHNLKKTCNAYISLETNWLEFVGLINYTRVKELTKYTRTTKISGQKRWLHQSTHGCFRCWLYRIGDAAISRRLVALLALCYGCRWSSSSTSPPHCCYQRPFCIRLLAIVHYPARPAPHGPSFFFSCVLSHFFLFLYWSRRSVPLHVNVKKCGSLRSHR